MRINMMYTLFFQGPEDDSDSTALQNGHNVSDEDYTVKQFEVDPPSWEEDN